MPIGKKKFETAQALPERRMWRVLNRTTKQGVVGIKLDGKEYKYNKQGFFDTDDQGLAHAIHDTQGQGGTGDCLTIPTEKPMNPTHRRTFAGIQMPWHKDKEK